MRCSDGQFYVVKFQNNPQHRRVLANELLATKLAEHAGLPVAPAEIVQVRPWLVEHSPEMRYELGGKSVACSEGLQFGSRFVVPPLEGQVYDYLPEGHLDRVRDLGVFAGMLVLDKWTCNANGRQAVFWKRNRERKFAVSFIDQGYCFNAGEWTFPDAPLRGVYGRNEVYRTVCGWDSFEPWLSRIESFDPEVIAELACGIPPEWYGDWDDLARLVDMLVARRTRVRELIAGFRDSSRRPFPGWGQGMGTAG